VAEIIVVVSITADFSASIRSKIVSVSALASSVDVFLCDSESFTDKNRMSRDLNTDVTSGAGYIPLLG
jgi:hypothetical protein